MKTRFLTTTTNDAIRANGILAKLRPSAARELAQGATRQRFERGEVICHEEEPVVRFWLVLGGEIKLVKYTARGLPLLIEIVLPNQIFGAVFHSPMPAHSCTALAMKPAELVSFRLKDLIGDLDGNSSLQRALLAETCSKLCQAQHMRGLGLEQVPVRIAHLLLHLHARFGRVIPETRSTLAELAGTSVETAIRTSRALARRGIIHTRRGQIEILSLAGLEACARNNCMEL